MPGIKPGMTRTYFNAPSCPQTAARFRGGAAEDLARTCHAHPTLPEAVKEAAMAVAKRAIHM